MPKAARDTDNPFGRKMLDILREKGTPDDLNALAAAFGVKVPSVYDWINHGRFAKERFADLVAWAGKSLHWWFDIPSTIEGQPESREPSRTYGSSWPFPLISQAELCTLDPLDRARLEAALLAIAQTLGIQLKRRAA